MNKAANDVTALSTFGLKSVASEVVYVTTIETLRETLPRIQKTSTPFIVIGGGSNSLFAPVISKTLVVMAITGISYAADTVTAYAGVVWDDLVRDTIQKGYGGLEALSAIPGSVGAAPIQNIGAYGTEVSEHIVDVTAYDIAADSFITISGHDCGFGYRTSNFKTIWAGKYIVLAVTLRLATHTVAHIAYPGIEAFLPADQVLTPTVVRDAVIAIRWSKLPKPEVLPNVGSFFHNPIVAAATAQSLQQLFPAMPTYPTDQENFIKLSAGWLIDQCGWKGKQNGTVGMYEKNALVMVNYGDATLDDVLRLQSAIQDSVQKTFGVMLTREPAIIQ